MSSEHPGLSAAATRKEDHIRLAAEQQAAGPHRNDFDDLEFLHHALAGIDADRVDLTASVGPFTWPVPVYVNGMTGGTDHAREINRALAVAARETGAPIASGSLGIAVDAPETASTFTVLREENPDGFVMANLGAGRPAEHAKIAVDLLAADALQLHLNAVQETVMPEGSREFSSWLTGVEATVAASPVPVIVKEVGFGLSRSTLITLRDLGVQVADVAGVGGTDFAKIEAGRRQDPYAHLIGFGQSAASCLLDAPEGITVLSSGGVRSPLDVAKSLALGAAAAGAAGPMLAAAMEGEEAAVGHMRTWISRVKDLLALLGASTPQALTSTDVLIRGNLREFAQLRGIDPRTYARRSVAGQRTGETQ
ncbi:MAG: type 2 isopentenyl-diphosphate Delta-isomerase [Galactobacter sp.]